MSRESTLVVVLTASLALVGCGRAGGKHTPSAAGDTAATSVRVPLDTLGPSGEDAAAAVRTYLTALVQRDYARAASLWEEGATPGAGDGAAFRRAHGDTTVKAFEVGTPGGMEGAAGSRYIQVPITMQGTVPERPPLRLHGIVTLRRSVVDGASEAQRRWRISRLEWSSNAKPPQGR